MVETQAKNKIRHSFSKAATRYEKAASLQKEIGLELLDEIKSQNLPKRILDVGTGTGWLAEKISQEFPQSRIIGVDFADGMIECARKKNSFGLVGADCLHLPFKAGLFDLIVSNLVYQWVKDLKQAFGEVYRALERNGIFYATLFSARTLEELFVSLEKGGAREKLRRLPSENNIRRALVKSGFVDCQLSSSTRRVYFADMLSLIKWLKQIGANVPDNRFFIGKELLLRANEFYKNNFFENGQAYALFETISVKARK